MIHIKLIDDHGNDSNFVTLVQTSVGDANDALVDSLPKVARGAYEIGILMDDLRLISIQHFCVILHMPSLGHTNVINKDYNMNIFDGLTTHIDNKSDLPERLIAPYGDTLPEDGLLQYVAVETVADVIALSGPKAVIVLRNDQERLLKCLSSFADLFGFQAVVLAGVPGATYTGEFDSVTWELPRVAYHSVINDLAEANRRQESADDEHANSSIYNKEMSRITRKSGGVKTFEAFDVPLSMRGAAPASASAEEISNDDND